MDERQFSSVHVGRIVATYFLSYYAVALGPVGLRSSVSKFADDRFSTFAVILSRFARARHRRMHRRKRLTLVFIILRVGRP